MQYDVFISHASENKGNFVEPMAKALQEGGLKVWYDRFELKMGDSLRDKIDQGLSNSKYGVVVLSKAFFSKEWPQTELDALVTRQNNEGKKVVLPIWHNVSAEEVRKFSPILASKLAARSADGINAVVGQILDVVKEDGAKPASVFQVGQNYGLREQCLEVIRQNDIVAWRKLIVEKTRDIPQQFKAWKSEGETAANKGGKEWESAVIDAAKICLPGFIPIFSAIESGNKDFWRESVGILRRLIILEDELMGGATWVVHIGNSMLFVAGSLGMSVAANLKSLELIEEWMRLKMPDKLLGEISWLQVRSAHNLPEGIKLDLNEPFAFFKNICNSSDLKSFLPIQTHFSDNILSANLLCSLIELRTCIQDQKYKDSITTAEYFYPSVIPYWCLLPADKFKIMTLDLFGDSQGVIRFVYPSGFLPLDKFWPLWKEWKVKCLTLWWKAHPHHFDFLRKQPWMLLPGEQAI